MWFPVILMMVCYYGAIFLLAGRYFLEALVPFANLSVVFLIVLLNLVVYNLKCAAGFLWYDDEDKMMFWRMGRFALFLKIAMLPHYIVAFPMILRALELRSFALLRGLPATLMGGYVGIIAMYIVTLLFSAAFLFGARRRELVSKGEFGAHLSLQLLPGVDLLSFFLLWRALKGRITEKTAQRQGI